MKKKRIISVVLLCAMAAMAGCSQSPKEEYDDTEEAYVSSKSDKNDKDEAEQGGTEDGDSVSAESGADGSNAGAAGSLNIAGGALEQEEATEEAEVPDPDAIIYHESENVFKQIDFSFPSDVEEITLIAAQDMSEAWGYIDTQGNWVIEPQFSRAYNFSCGYAAVVAPDDMAYFIDTSGKFVLDIYSSIGKWGGFVGFNHGYAFVEPRNGLGQIIDIEGNVTYEGETSGSGTDLGMMLMQDGESFDGCIVNKISDVISSYDMKMHKGTYSNGLSVSPDGETIRVGREIYSKDLELLATLDESVDIYDIMPMKSGYIIRSNSSFAFYDFSMNLLHSVDRSKIQSMETLSNDLVLLKNTAGNYCIIGLDGTEYMPYEIGRKRNTRSYDSFFINGKEYWLFDKNDKLEYFSIEDKKLVEMEPQYDSRVKNLGFNDHVLTRDKYSFGENGIAELVTNDDGTQEYVSYIYLSLDDNYPFCYKHNVFAVKDGNDLRLAWFDNLGI